MIYRNRTEESHETSVVSDCRRKSGLSSDQKVPCSIPGSPGVLVKVSLSTEPLMAPDAASSVHECVNVIAASSCTRTECVWEDEAVL